MALAFVRVLLADGKVAIRVDGHPSSPMWFRVRLLSKEMVESAANEPPELKVKIEAYQVDSNGAIIPDGAGPVLFRTITAESLALGAQSMQNERVSLSKDAIRKAVRSITEIGPIGQLGVELVD